MKTKLAIVEPAPELDPLEQARADLRAANAEIEGLRQARDRLSSVIGVENEALAEIGAIGAREAAAFRAWAAAGGIDPAPELLIAERREAAERLALAQAKAAGAERAIVQVDADILAKSQAARELSVKVDVAIFDQLVDDYEASISAAVCAFDGARQKAAEAFGLRSALWARAHEMRAEGKEVELSHTIMRRLEGLSDFQTDFAGAPTNAEVAAAKNAALSQIYEFSRVQK